MDFHFLPGIPEAVTAQDSPTARVRAIGREEVADGPQGKGDPRETLWVLTSLYGGEHAAPMSLIR